MEWPSLIAGFILGFAGSLHCVGMCGPLSLALPTYHLSKNSKFFSLLLYQVGRTITYSLLGLLSGLAGRSIYISGIQQWFSILLGILILVMAVLYFSKRKGVHISVFKGFYSSVQTLIGRIMNRRAGIPGFFVMGMANGLLPCGMVYIALASTLSFRSLTESIGFMAMFGMGTLPAMMLVGYGGRLLKPGTKTLFRKLVPYFITVTGIILILRGLNLGIMFISPELPSSAGQVISCPH
jgi:sulfite exporter TauE/SafE